MNNELMFGILLCLLVIVFIWCIVEGVNKDLINKLSKQKETNQQILGLYQTECDKTDTLYRIILHIRHELSFLKQKNCPAEEFKNIPFEIIEWIDTLEKVSNGDEDGIHQ